MKIKTIGIKYPQKRLVLDKVENVKYYKIQNYVNPFIKKMDWFEVWKPLFDFNIDGYHTVNTIMLTTKPWCCNFEDWVPRGGGVNFWRYAYYGMDNGVNHQIHKMMNVIAKTNCKRLMALSECNYKMQMKFYDYYGHTELTDKLREKTCVVRVPQELLVDSYKENVNAKIRFVFVGNDFSRKGGREILDVFREISKTRNDFELHLVTLTDNRHNCRFLDYQDSKEEVDELIEWSKQQKWIFMYSNLPNNEVLALIKKCDVGMLPTWFDTYGYSALEMQACGLPVISTNVRALPEINQKGWKINLPVNFNNEVAANSFEEKVSLRNSMQKQMYDIIINILDNPNSIIERGKASYDYIKQYHSMSEYSNIISNIYSEFVNL